MAKHQADDGLSVFMGMKETRLREYAKTASEVTGLSFNTCSELLLLGWSLHIPINNVPTWIHPSVRRTK